MKLGLAGTKTQTQYTDKVKRDAVETAARLGLRAASRELDIPETNIRRWAKKPKYAANGAQKSEVLRDGNPRADLRKKLDKIADLSSDRILEILKRKKKRKVPLTYSLRDLSTVLGISTDKIQKLSGDIPLEQEPIEVTYSFENEDKSDVKSS